MKRIGLFLLAFFSLSLPVQAQVRVEWKTVKESSPGVYTNLVITGDGFGKQDLGKIISYAETTRDTLAAYAARDGWSDQFAKMRIVVGLVLSPESGVSYPQRGIRVNNTFGSFFPDTLSTRIDLSEQGWQDLVALANKIPGGFDPEKDLIFLLENEDKDFGGTFWEVGPYKIAIATTNKIKKFFIHDMLHEMLSHGYGGTADEYPQAAEYYESLNYFREEWPNLMRILPEKLPFLRREEIKWINFFSDRNIDFPTPWSPENKGKVAFFTVHPGAKTDKHFIPRMFCVMNGGVGWSWDFCPVCRKAIKDGLARRLAVLAADFDRDGDVDLEDFFLFSEGFGKNKSQTGFVATYDLNSDGDVGFDDFFIFADSFGKKSGARKPVPATKPVAIGQIRRICYHIESGSDFGHNHEIIPSGSGNTGPTLNQNFPNPFNPETTISYILPERAIVSLTVYNLLGQQVAVLIDGDTEEAGSYKIRWDGRDKFGHKLASGIYFYILETEKFSEKRSMVLIK